MKSKKDIELELNKNATPLLAFLSAYNQMIPPGFPQANALALKKFQQTYPLLFKNGDEWSIDKHRKKVMDWLLSHREVLV